VVLLILGPKGLPADGRALGRAIREFRGTIIARGGDASAESEREQRANP
jgi:Sec-independent protein translocase protein TatA